MRRYAVLLTLILLCTLTPGVLHAASSQTALTYSTFLGGTNEDQSNAVAVDSSGCAYVAGWTYSADFPTTTGAFQPSLKGTFNAFVTKLNSTGSSLVYSTYLGGSGAEIDDTYYGDEAYSIAVDSADCAYVVGQTYSTDFPVTTGAFQTSLKSTTYGNAFVTKLSSAGSSLVYSTFLGGSDGETGTAIAVDSANCAYATGMTYSTDFPTTTGAFDLSLNSIEYGDSFVTKLNSTGSSLVYSTYLGGSDGDYTTAIALDSVKNVYLVGQAYSTDFPTTSGAFQTSLIGSDSNAFVTKLNSTGSSLVYSTYLGGSGSDGDEAYGVALDSSNSAYVAGYTSSGDFPTTSGAFQVTLNSVTGDGFVTKLNSTGSSLDYSTFLGGSGSNGDSANGISVDSAGNAYVAGYTSSTDFPTTNGALQTALNTADGNAFVTKLNSAGSSLLYSTYLGGSGSNGYGDAALGIALDSTGSVYVTGYTTSTDFPITTGAFQTALASTSGNAFVSKLSLSTSILAGLASNGSIWYTTDFINWNQVPGSLSTLVIGDFAGNGSNGLAGLASNDSIWYTTDLMNWTEIPGQLQSLVTGDFTGSGQDGVAGLGPDGRIWYTSNLQNWTNIPGYLNTLTAGNFAGNGAWGVAGLSSNNSIWASLNLLTWSNIPGQLNTIVPGDFGGSGQDGIAGLGAGGSIWYTPDLSTWNQVPGSLSSLVVGDFGGSGKDGIAGLASNGSIWYTADLQTWNNIPGSLNSLIAGSFGSGGKDGLAGLSSNGSIWYTTDLQSWTQVPGQLSTLVSRRNQ